MRSLFFSSKLHPFSSVFKNSRFQMTTAAATAATNRRRKKVVVMMGPTGSGKSKLSIDLVTRFFPKSEIINSDKIQVYSGLDITTNKISMQERKGVFHHFLGEFDPDTEFTPSEFRSLGAKTIAGIVSRNKIPFIVGGSNSFIYSLFAKRFNPKVDVFDDDGDDDSGSGESVCSELRYRCCFIWVDVSMPVLTQYLNKRVDEMLDSGMFDELAEYFDNKVGFNSGCRTGLKKAIGVPEFEQYFRKYGGRRPRSCNGGVGDGDDDVEETRSYEEAVKAIKDNTCQLAKRQLGKILRLRDAGWDLHRIDATEAVRAVMMTSEDPSTVVPASEVWEKQVVQPSMKIVKQFLMD